MRASAALCETLQLDGSGTDWWQLTRTLAAVDAAGMPQAQVIFSGNQPGALLAALRGVDAGRCLHFGPGWVIARRSWRSPNTQAEPVLTESSAAVEGLSLQITVPSTSGVSASLALEPAAVDGFDLPQDLLAMPGWN